MAAMCHFQATAQPTDIQVQLDALQQRLDEVQSDTAGMRNELDALKVEEQDWLTQERAIEIKALVRDVLADADARNSLAGDGLLGGWSDGFFLASSDGRFKLNIGGLMQQRFFQSYVTDLLSHGELRYSNCSLNSNTYLIRTLRLFKTVAFAHLIRTPTYFEQFEGERRL